MFIQYLQTNPVYYFSWVFAVLISVVLHELGHGVAAIWQGDDTPTVLGHMTFDPMVHMGGLGLGLLFFVGLAFGAMPVNPSRFRSKYGDALVSFAGPAVNILLAILALAALGLWTMLAGFAQDGAAHNFQNFLWMMGYLNVALAVLNMLPIMPLDGGSVLGNLWPAFGRFGRNPNNQPIFLGALLLVIITAGKWLLPFSESVAIRFLRLFPAG